MSCTRQLPVGPHGHLRALRNPRFPSPLPPSPSESLSFSHRGGITAFEEEEQREEEEQSERENEEEAQKDRRERERGASVGSQNSSREAAALPLSAGRKWTRALALSMGQKPETILAVSRRCNCLNPEFHERSPKKCKRAECTEEMKALCEGGECKRDDYTAKTCSCSGSEKPVPYASNPLQFKCLE
eukprot:Cvel_20496.t1-p1 / transcript=Cvel_20496.t1 / gene=Cvel_20496 / organism=Chromera_velia_CCMP2878 / gene_product=hypothetical protein / transcript_product=hypothetical protein / location=Cvel_scaffold1844:1350-5836(-) / protein_length=186 / sequence_SO=supercontig / SO=protein_coding / is_pseudo=false